MILTYEQGQFKKERETKREIEGEREMERRRESSGAVVPGYWKPDLSYDSFIYLICCIFLVFYLPFPLP